MIKLFEQYKEYDQVKTWLDEMGIKNYIINDDLTVDVDGNVDISYRELSRIPIQFGNVDGYFFCYGNKLKSLKGSPKYVSDSFGCNDNNLTSLKYSPEIVERNFICSYNKELTSLKYSPLKIGGDYDIPGCSIRTFNCGQIKIGGSFDIQDNRLTSLNNCPIPVKNIYISGNPLPQEVLNRRYISRAIIEHQNEYGIWNSDDSLNKRRFDIFIQDYDDGILD